jgi:prevent-host-death family protein
MDARLQDFGFPEVPPSITTNEFRDHFSRTINRAAFGSEPVLVTRRGMTIAAIISIQDFEFLERMRQRREEAKRQELPSDASQIGPALAERLRWELFFR